MKIGSLSKWEWRRVAETVAAATEGTSLQGWGAETAKKIRQQVDDQAARARIVTGGRDEEVL